MCEEPHASAHTDGATPDLALRVAEARALHHAGRLAAATGEATQVITEARARELIGEVLERTSGDTLPFYTAEAWLRDWVRGKQISKSEGTHASRPMGGRH